MYFWGLAHNPVTNELWVGDYFNSRVRRITPTGDRLPDAEFQWVQNASAIAIDPRTGDAYVASQGNVILKYDRDGNFVRQWPMEFAATFLAVDQAGNLWGTSRHQDAGQRIRVKQWDTATGAGIKTITLDLAPYGVTGSTTSLGIDIDAEGHLWVSESISGKVIEATQTGTILRVWGTKGPGPGRLGGDLRGLEVDDVNGWVYVGEASSDTVEKFDLDGNPLRTIGGTGSGAGQLRGVRQITLDPDGNLWVAEYGNHRAQLFSPDGASLRIIPDPEWSAPAPHLSIPDDVAIDPLTGRVWITDQYNHRVVILDRDGRLVATRGSRGSNTEGGGMNYPRAIAFDAETRRVWIGQHEAGSITVYDADSFNFLYAIEEEDNPRHTQRLLFGITDIDFVGDEAWITLQKKNYLAVLDRHTGELLRTLECCGPTQSKSALGIDPETGNIFVGNKAHKRIDVYSPSWELLYTFGTPGTGPGQFGEPFEVAIVGDEVWVADNTRSLLMAFTKSGQFLGALGGGYGSNANQFRNPHSLAVDGNLLYVTDSNNARVVVYDLSQPRGAGDGQPPTLTITDPSAPTSSASGRIRLSGTAADANGVIGVELTVQDLANGRWWNGLTGTWDTAAFWNLAPLVSNGRPATSTTFQYTFAGAEAGHTYRFVARARDAFNALSLTSARHVTFVAGPAPTDETEPTTTITNPTDGATVPRDPLTFSGTASDDVGVTGVGLVIRDDTTGLFWNGTGWGPTPVSLAATLDAPGPSANWERAWTPPANGDYSITATASDAAGNRDSSAPTIRITVVGDDLAKPTAAVTSPEPGASVTRPVVVSGTAADDVGVTKVEIAFRREDTQQWWNGTIWRNHVWTTATVALPNATLTTWEAVFDAPYTGVIGYKVRAFDAAGNISDITPWRTFTVS